MKRCTNKKCPMTNPQPRSKFNRCRKAADGLQTWCKTCQSMSNSRNRKPRTRHKDNPELFNAYRRIRASVKAGEIVAKPCQVCGDSSKPRLFLRSPTAKPQWFCWYHHPNRSGNRTIRVEVPDP